jgi:monoamine oxidase
MPHDPLTRLLQKAFGSLLSGEDQKLMNRRQANRRRFLKNTACVAGGLLIPSLLRENMLKASRSPSPSKIAIIGAGIAGLNAAYQLKQHDITATIYEASGRVGGRMYTLKDQFGPGLTTDVGGEFVDTSHTDILDLVNQLGLSCYDLRKDPRIAKTFWFEGRLLGEKELREAISPYIGTLMKDIHSLPPVISYKSADAFRHFDEMSILDYLRSIGIGGWLFKFLNVLLTREYGMEASEQSAINFLIMFEPPAPTDSRYEVFGQDHEIFKIRGGSQRLTDKLFEQVRDQVILRRKLTAIHTNAQQGYDLYFGDGPDAAILQADQVILAIPFTILRSIDIQVPMPEGKRKCIREMGYGNSCKFIMGMKENPWRRNGSQGYTFTDLSFGCGWDSSQMQSDHASSFTVFGGGNFAQWVLDNKEEDIAGKFLPDLNTIYPGAAKEYTGRNVKFCWAGNPYSKAGYSSFKPGQWSTLAGWEAEPVGNIYFAGEQVSREFQGYMNGAAQTGKAAAERVVANLKKGQSANK